MFREILSSRGLIFGFAFFVLIVAGTQFYSWHVHRTGQYALERTKRKLQQLRKDNEMSIAQEDGLLIDTETLDPSEISIDADETRTMSEDADVLPRGGTAGVDMMDEFLPDDMVSTEAETTAVSISPFGFGPYPEIPADFPHGASWLEETNARRSLQAQRSQELICRVMIKAWTDGDHYFKGASFDRKSGKVYLNYPDRLYVRYRTFELSNGKVIRHLAHAKGTHHNLLTLEQMRSGDIPPDIQAIPMESAGIDPQTYLNLPSSAF